MTIHALVLGETSVRLWGLSSTERLRRQLREAGGLAMVNSAGELPPTGKHLLLDARYLFEVRTLAELKIRDNMLLICPADGGVAAAVIDSGHLQQAIECRRGERSPAPRIWCR